MNVNTQVKELNIDELLKRVKLILYKISFSTFYNLIIIKYATLYVV